MAEIDKKTIRNLTELSRIHCSEEDEAALMQDLSSIVDYITKLEEIDTEGVEPCSYVLKEAEGFMRDDEPGRTLPRDEFLENAPDHTEGMIRVPTVIKQGES